LVHPIDVDAEEQLDQEQDVDAELHPYPQFDLLLRVHYILPHHNACQVEDANCVDGELVLRALQKWAHRIDERSIALEAAIPRSPWVAASL